MTDALPEQVVVIGLGGNLGGADAIVDRFVRARAAFTAWGAVRGSAVYRSAPIGGPAVQPDYLNAALLVAIDPPDPRPADLIAAVLEIERELGRDRRQEIEHGPRAIDLDVLLWGTRHARWDGLVVPHPRLAARRFALAPVIDLLGAGFVMPGTVSTVGALWRGLADQRVDPTELRV
jgi:2-amino-4-hydroxy-6-hydroxymethyldihydropteridine diphosphokinase